jgi:LuxR family maltose regulon positive regulatory protein
VTTWGRSATRRAPAIGRHAARLLGDHLLELVLDGRMAAVRELLRAFPRHAPASDAELALASAMASAFDGLDDESAAHLAVAEQLTATLPDDRRRRFELGLAGTRLWLARLRGDVGEASEAFDAVEAALCALPRRAGAHLSAPGHGAAEPRHRGGLLVAAARGCRRLEQALGLARRLRRPYLEMSCLATSPSGPLAAAAVSAARRTAEQAVAIAAEHGWDTDHDPAAAFAVSAMALMWLGRFADGARRSTAPRRRWPAPTLPRSRFCSTAPGLSAASEMAGSTTRRRPSRRRRTPCGPCRASTR